MSRGKQGLLVALSANDTDELESSSGSISGVMSWKLHADTAMTRYGSGDDAAFGDLYDVLAPRLFGFFKRHVRSTPRAEDLVQQTFLLMHRARGRFVPGASVTAWAFAIGRRLYIDTLRRGKPEVSLPDDDVQESLLPPPELHEAEDSTHGAVDARRSLEILEAELLRSLPEHRQLFELVHQDGLSLGEAAAVLGITTNAAKLRLHRLTTALRAAVMGEGARSSTVPSSTA